MDKFTTFLKKVKMPRSLVFKVSQMQSNKGFLGSEMGEVDSIVKE